MQPAQKKCSSCDVLPEHFSRTREQICGTGQRRLQVPEEQAMCLYTV